MPENYKPSLTEITIETIKELYDDSKTLVESIGRGGRVFLATTIFANTMLYHLPTVHRAFKENEPSERDTPLSFYIGGGLGSLGGGIGLAAQGRMYYQAMKEGHPEYLLIPVATNIASGLYEKARNAKKRLTKQQDTENPAK